jgi:hypothetical protein
VQLQKPKKAGSKSDKPFSRLNLFFILLPWAELRYKEMRMLYLGINCKLVTIK